MTTALDVTTLGPATLRFLLASCAADPDGPMTPPQKAVLWRCLGDHRWRPTAYTMPMATATLQAWCDGLQGRALAWIRETLDPQEEDAGDGL